MRTGLQHLLIEQVDHRSFGKSLTGEEFHQRQRAPEIDLEVGAIRHLVGVGQLFEPEQRGVVDQNIDPAGLPEQPLRLAGQGEVGGEHPVPGRIRQRGGQRFGLGA